MMEYFEKVHITEIITRLPSNYAFICCASFENRCCTLPESINTGSISKAYVIRNIAEDMKQQNENNFQSICAQIPCASPVEVLFDNPLSLTDRLLEIIDDLKKEQTKNLVVDISTFTHELLLMILKIIYINAGDFESVLLIYNGASEYANWLSKGCKEVRNVIGYPGIFNPAQKYHVVILTGFELERATRLVELLDPDTLSIGTGIEPTSVNHQEPMIQFQVKFKEWLGNLQSVNHNEFAFSCSDIIGTISNIQKILDNSPNDNFIFIPLNTKLSTIALGLVALYKPTVQVCYPIPEIYNTTYSKPSESFTTINFKELLYHMEKSYHC